MDGVPGLLQTRAPHSCSPGECGAPVSRRQRWRLWRAARWYRQFPQHARVPPLRRIHWRLLHLQQQRRPLHGALSMPGLSPFDLQAAGKVGLPIGKRRLQPLHRRLQFALFFRREMSRCHCWHPHFRRQPWAALPGYPWALAPGGAALAPHWLLWQWPPAVSTAHRHQAPAP